MDFERLHTDNALKIKEMSDMATEIVREYYDPIIGAEHNSHLLNKFQTADAITDQIRHGYRYYFIKKLQRFIT